LVYAPGRHDIRCAAIDVAASACRQLWPVRAARPRTTHAVGHRDPLATHCGPTSGRSKPPFDAGCRGPPPTWARAVRHAHQAVHLSLASKLGLPRIVLDRSFGSPADTVGEIRKALNRSELCASVVVSSGNVPPNFSVSRSQWRPDFPQQCAQPCSPATSPTVSAAVGKWPAGACPGSGA